MTRDDLTRALGELERLRMDSYEAGSQYEALRIQRAYDQLWSSIQPYCTGEIRCSDDPPELRA